MIIKLPTLKAEEGKKVRGPSLGPSERVSILLELVDALRMNGELVRKARLFSPGTGACWSARVGLGTRPFDSGECLLRLTFESLFVRKHSSLLLKGLRGSHGPQDKAPL